jgi:hypothetical protein
MLGEKDTPTLLETNCLFARKFVYYELPAFVSLPFLSFVSSPFTL